MKTIDLAGWLAAARLALAGVTDQPALEAQALLGGVLAKSKAWLFAHPEHALAPTELDQLNTLLARRQNGEPLPYLLGRWEFYGLEFEVSPAVLIPRPETELLVDHALAWLRAHPGRRAAVDVGTGSGCIAVALAKKCPHLSLAAVDLSFDALRVAHKNVAAHHLDGRIRLAQADLLAPLAGPFDLLCANLPYIPSDLLGEIAVARFEPRLALDGGPDGLRLVDRLLEQARRRMRPGSRLLAEIEFSQGECALELAQGYFPGAEIQLVDDYARLPRLVIIDV